MSTKYVALGIVALIALYFIAIIAGIVALPFHSIGKQQETAHDIIDQTYTADNAIYNYEWFKTQYEKIEATKQNIEATDAQVKDFKEVYGNSTEWDYTTKQQYTQLQTQRTGQIQYCNDLIADYNARSKMANRAIFNDNLPMFVDEILPMTNI